MVLVFDVASEIAMFRRPYTTTSAVSFPFPPPTAVAGLIGAIVGLNNGADAEPGAAAYWPQMGGIRVALALKSPVRWWVTSLNLLEFKTASGSLDTHIRVKHQFVKRPVYRVYVQRTSTETTNAVYDELRARLMRSEFVYTPYLGAAYCLADVRYVGEYAGQEVHADAVHSDGVELTTVLPLSKGVEVDVMASRGVHREVVPFRLDPTRGLQGSVVVLYTEPAAGPDDDRGLRLKKPGESDITRVGDELVAWFKPW